MPIRCTLRGCFSFMLVLAWACSSDSVSREAFEDEGDLCLQSSDDGSLQVAVIFPTCLSSSCSRVLQASCNVELDGGRLVISSRGSAEHSGATCTADCGSLVAECRSEVLDPGQYEVVHGDASYQVTLPTEGASVPREGLWSCPFPVDAAD